MNDPAARAAPPVRAGSVLDRDPDLGEDLRPDEFAIARRHAIARVLRYPRGPWNPDPSEFDGIGSLGLLVIEGILVRKVTVGERSCAELLGPGDVTQPWLKVGPDLSVGTDVSWEVAEPVRIAVLDRAFVTQVARWPEISAAVARRIMLRVYWLSFHLAVCHMRRVEDRLMLVLWHFADRWGRVTPRGVEIPLRLPHRLLALVVGAHRPTVTTALRTLIAAGRLEARPRSHWVLRGDPPEEFRQVREHAAGYDRPSPIEIQWRPSSDTVVAEHVVVPDPSWSGTFTAPALPAESVDVHTATMPPVTLDSGTSTLEVDGSPDGSSARTGPTRHVRLARRP